MPTLFFKLFTAQLLLFFALSGFGQDAQELEAERLASGKLKGEHPLVKLAKEKPSSLKKELEGVHPRVFVTQSEIDALKLKAKSQPELWQTAISRVRALMVEPAKPPAEERRVQNEVGLGIAEASFIYKITGDKSISMPPKNIWMRRLATMFGVTRITNRMLTSLPDIFCMEWVGVTTCYTTI